MRVVITFLLISITSAVTAQKQLSGAALLRGGMSQVSNQPLAGWGQVSVLAGKKVGFGFGFGVEKNHLMSKVAYPLLIEISTIGTKQESGIKPMMTAQGGWVVGKEDFINMNATARVLAGARVHFKNGNYSFVQVGYLRQWYEFLDGQEEYGSFIACIGLKF